MWVIFSTIFNTFYAQWLNCVFSAHAICTADDYFIIVTHTLHLSLKKHTISALVIRGCYYYRHCHRYDFCLHINYALPVL